MTVIISIPNATKTDDTGEPTNKNAVTRNIIPNLPMCPHSFFILKASALLLLTYIDRAKVGMGDKDSDSDGDCDGGNTE